MHPHRLAAELTERGQYPARVQKSVYWLLYTRQGVRGLYQRAVSADFSDDPDLDHLKSQPISCEGWCFTTPLAELKIQLSMGGVHHPSMGWCRDIPSLGEYQTLTRLNLSKKGALKLRPLLPLHPKPQT